MLHWAAPLRWRWRRRAYRTGGGNTSATSATLQACGEVIALQRRHFIVLIFLIVLLLFLPFPLILFLKPGWWGRFLAKRPWRCGRCRTFALALALNGWSSFALLTGW